jgi:anti-sigma B factor antagonist
MSNYNYVINENKPQLVKIELNEQVLGGSDALEFSSLLHELSEKNIKYVAADLNKVQIMNSSGLGMLVSGLTSLKKNNINFILVSVPQKIMSLLLMTHLDKVFRIFDDEKQALEQCT